MNIKAVGIVFLYGALNYAVFQYIATETKTILRKSSIGSEPAAPTTTVAKETNTRAEFSLLKVLPDGSTEKNSASLNSLMVLTDTPQQSQLAERIEKLKTAIARPPALVPPNGIPEIPIPTDIRIENGTLVAESPPPERGCPKLVLYSLTHNGAIVNRRYRSVDEIFQSDSKSVRLVEVNSYRRAATFECGGIKEEIVQ